MEDEPETEGDRTPLPDRIYRTRRQLLAGLAVGGAAAAGVAMASTNNQGGDLLLGGLDAPLTQQYRKDAYVTAPASAFDASALSTGELAWITDTGQFGVIDEDGDIGSPPIGTDDNPIPEIHSESLATEVLKSGPYSIEHNDEEDTLDFIYDED